MIIVVLKWFLLSWVLTNWSLSLTEFMTPSKSRNKWIKFFVSIFQYIMSCPKCLSFWTILLLTGDFFIAAGVSFLIMSVNKLTQNIKTKL